MNNEKIPKIIYTDNFIFTAPFTGTYHIEKGRIILIEKGEPKNLKGDAKIVECEMGQKINTNELFSNDEKKV